MTAYVPPPYPYDRLNTLKPFGEPFDGGLINLSIGAPHDPAPPAALKAMYESDAERGYPPSPGFPEAREACSNWLERRFGVSVPASQVALVVGSKEFVVSVPRYLALRTPDRDTILHPEIGYPSYAMAAELAGLRAVAVPMDENWRPKLDEIDPADAARAFRSRRRSCFAGCLGARA